MPAFDIVRTSPIADTYRAARIASDFDYRAKSSEEHFTGSFDLPDDWNIGLIVGASGTGKTTIARELFGDSVVSGFEYSGLSVLDDMPQNCSLDEITRTNRRGATSIRPTRGGGLRLDCKVATFRYVHDAASRVLGVDNGANA